MDYPKAVLLLAVVSSAFADTKSSKQQLSPLLISKEQTGITVDKTVDRSETEKSPKSNGSICATTTCANKAKEVLSYMNISADPCEDFYEYACGRYSEHHEIKSDQTSVTPFYYQGEKLLNDLRRVLESNETEASPARQTARQLYKVCLDKETLRKQGVQPVTDMLSKTIGGWPLLTPNWNPDNFDIWKTLLHLAEYDFRPLISVTVMADWKNASINRLMIGIPRFFKKDFLSSSTGKRYIASYPKYMLDFTKTFASLSTSNGDFEARYNWTDIEIQLNKSHEFSLFMTNVSATALELRDGGKFHNLRKLTNVTSSMFFRSNFSRGLYQFVQDSAALGEIAHLVNNDAVVNVLQPSALEAFDREMLQIEQLGVEGKRFLANHLGWKIVAEYSSDLSRSLRDLFDHQEMILSGKNLTDPVWKQCVRMAQTSLPLAVASLYVDQVLDKHIKEKVSDMVSNIRTSFANGINSADWMDLETRNRALEKLHQMLEFNVYPDFYTINITLIEEMYENITIGTEMFDTSLALKRDSNIRSTKRLDKINTREYFLDRLDTVTTNAQYWPNYNIIAIFAGFSQPPFFDVDIPDYFNYGSLGHIIGHEMTHGFDDQGSRFDETGKLFNWWSNSSREAFANKAALIVEQYGNYRTPYGNVNGNLTLGENIADAGGLKTTFNAYQLHLQRMNGTDLPLPGLRNHTNNMMFFLSAAQVWCGIQRTEIDQIALVGDPHSPRRWRVNGEMATFREFAKAYNCPPESPMIYNQSNGLWR